MSEVKTINELFDFLPHRYPFLLVDRVTETVAGERIKGYKNITANEELFNGHFPGQPIFPGVLILEAMARCRACWPSRRGAFGQRTALTICLVVLRKRAFADRSYQAIV